MLCKYPAMSTYNFHLTTTVIPVNNSLLVILIAVVFLSFNRVRSAKLEPYVGHGLVW
jgi:hypothetical protein